MATRRADAIRRNYHVRLRAIRAEMMRRLAAAYARVRQDDIRASYAAFVPLAARTITAAQAATQMTTRAYVRGTGGFEPAALASLAGTSKAGTITEALDGLDLFGLGQIAKGIAVSVALESMAGYVTRLADNELTRVVDAEIEGQAAASDRAVGWIGITEAPTDACIDNAGLHDFDVEIYRHPGCACEREIAWTSG